MDNKYDTPIIPFLNLDDKDLLFELQGRYGHATQGIFGFDGEKNIKHHEELLIRPKEGASAFDAFQEIQALEDNGKIHVLDQVNLMMVSEKLDKLKYPIAINISAMSFQNEEFIKVLKGFADRVDSHFGSRDNIVSIEITESKEIEDLDIVRDAMEHLKSCRISVYADDFGSELGHMNENIVMNLPFDSIKLDRDLVKNLDDPAVLERTKNIIQYAKDNDISVVAEFVDSQEIKDKIIELGVDYGQGFFLEKPKQLELDTPRKGTYEYNSGYSL